MTGELLIERNGGWRCTVPSLVLSCLFSAGLTALFLHRLSLTGMGLAVTAALVAYVLFRVFYPALTSLLSKGAAKGPDTWTVTEDTLLLGETAIPRASIRQVHCWPNRDALGHSGTGWTVNIETTGKNHVLRSLTQGDGAARSAQQLKALVEALGYGERWQET